MRRGCTRDTASRNWSRRRRTWRRRTRTPTGGWARGTARRAVPPEGYHPPMATAAPEQVNTKKVTGRRSLRFSTIDDVLADADRIAAADRAGTLKRLGNWTPGTIFTHVANWSSYPFDGYPEALG